ncbi:MAG TPA: hypothetical protein VFP36_02155, partial [Usitatibacter sp.]|nr:hypothetical protein [Usitatibacter sp.]
MRRPIASLCAFAALSALGEDRGVWSTWSALREGDGCRSEQTSLVPTPFRVCPGPERMRVLVETRGDRSWIDLVPEGSPFTERISLEQALQHERFGRNAHVSGGFIEWRYEGRSLMGLLVLMHGLEDKPGEL